MLCLNCSTTEATQLFHLSDTFSCIASGLYKCKDVPKTSPRVFPKSPRHAATARVPAMTPARWQTCHRELHMAACPHGSVPGGLLMFPCLPPAPRLNHTPRDSWPPENIYRSAHWKRRAGFPTPWSSVTPAHGREAETRRSLRCLPIQTIPWSYSCMAQISPPISESS